jgi:cytochrome P450 family 135
MRVVLAEVLRHMELEPSSRRAERTRVRHVTLTPQRGAVVTVRRRRTPAVDASAAPQAMVEVPADT